MTSKSQQSSDSGPHWAVEWVPLLHINKLDDLQVRSKLNSSAISRYRSSHEAGSMPPPIRVGRVGGALYLVDGWHRIEAGALNLTEGDFATGDTLVEAEVANLSEAEVRWEAARANMGHGVPLSAREMRTVAAAYIKAGKHRAGRGAIKSYRAMGADLGVKHTTLRNWIERDFPALFREIGGSEQGNPHAGPARTEFVPLAEVHRLEGLQAAASLHPALPLMTPEGRWEVLQELRRAIVEAERLGVMEPGGEF